EVAEPGLADRPRQHEAYPQAEGERDEAEGEGPDPHRQRAARSTTQSPSTRRSIRVRRKQSSASSGVLTMGSLSLNDVFKSMGTPVASSKALSSAQKRGFCSGETVCRRAVPSTWVTAGTCGLRSGRTGRTLTMKGSRP